MNSGQKPRKRKKPARGKSPAPRAARQKKGTSPTPKISVKRWILLVVPAVVLLVLALFVWAALARELAPVANTARAHFDTLIVLGSSSNPDGTPSPLQLARVNEGVREYERGVAPRILFTGGAVENRFVEAEVMAHAAEAQGVPSSAIVVEPQARDTIQNACFSVRFMKAHGWNSAEVISAASHLPRASMIFANMPVEYRVHAAEPLTPASAGYRKYVEALELLKTVRFLTLARLTERCEP